MRGSRRHHPRRHHPRRCYHHRIDEEFEAGPLARGARVQPQGL